MVDQKPQATRHAGKMDQYLARAWKGFSADCCFFPSPPCNKGVPLLLAKDRISEGCDVGPVAVSAVVASRTRISCPGRRGLRRWSAPTALRAHELPLERG
jgi:hypothetical protein